MDAYNHGERARRPTSALAKRPETVETLVTPVADIYETADAFTIKLDMPGTVKDSISVSVEPGYLAAKGVVAPYHREGSTLLLSELGRKSYFREFNLGEGVNHNNIQAQFEDGVLVITIPKTDDMKAHDIQIR